MDGRLEEELATYCRVVMKRPVLGDEMSVGEVEVEVPFRKERGEVGDRDGRLEARSTDDPSVDLETQEPGIGSAQLQQTTDWIGRQQAGRQAINNK